MRRRRREIQHCDPITEEFLKANPRFAATDGWFLTWCRMGNGGDPSYHSGPFRDDQLYLTHGELMTTYPFAGLEVYSTEGMVAEELFFPVIFGALLAYKKSDPEYQGWIYCESKWYRVPEFDGSSDEAREILGRKIVKQTDEMLSSLAPALKLIEQSAESEEGDDGEAREEYMEMYFFCEPNSDAQGGTNVYICPVKYFKEEGHCADSAYQPEFDAAIAKVDDGEFDELTDATYWHPKSVQEVTNMLLNGGFKQSEQFDNFMKTHI